MGKHDSSEDEEYDRVLEVNTVFVKEDENKAKKNKVVELSSGTLSIKLTRARIDEDSEGTDKRDEDSE